MSRLRQRSLPPDVVVLPYKLFFKPYTSIPDFVTRVTFESSESFKDEPDSADRSFKPCFHEKSESRVTGYKSAMWHDDQGSYLHPNHFGPVIDVSNHMKTAVIPVDAQAAALAKALRDIQPSIDSYVSTVNLYAIVLELAEVALLIPRMLEILHGSASLLDKGVDAYITHSFGYMPMFGDIERIARIFRDLDAAIDKWNDFALTSRTMDFHRTIYDVSEETETVVWSLGPNAKTEQGGPAVGSVTSTSKLHLYIKPHYISDDQRLSAFLKAFGLDKPFSGVWEAVPFSWAIDYFTNVGEIIESLDFDIANMFTFDFVDAGLSISDRVIYKYTSTLAHYKNTWYANYMDPCIRSTNIDRYERIRLSSSVFEEALRKSDLDFQVKTDLNSRQTSYLVSVGRIITRKG